MKKILYIILVTTLLSATSCTDLDVDVYSKIPMDDFLKNEEELLMYAGRAYTKLQPFPEEQRLWTLMTASSDEMVIPGRSDGEWWDNGRWNEIQLHSISATNKILRQSWEFVFQGILTCNKVLLEMEKTPFEFDAKSKIIAEVKILRALYYYWAIDCWGNIPFSIDFAETNLPPQKDRNYVYNYIEKEIKDNIQYLEEYPTTENYGRITKAMAFTLLAKLYINSEVWLGTSKWQETINMCDSIINMNNFSIEPNYFDNFKLQNEISKENIFVIVYDPLLTTEYFYWYVITLSADSKATYNLKSTPWDGFVCPPDFYQKYSTNDSRLGSWLTGVQYDASGKPIVVNNDTFKYNPIFTGYNPATDGGRHKWDGARCCKYEYDKAGLEYDVYDMGNDFVIFRYADVILMKAEALMRRDNSSANAVAIPELSTIRTRANQPVYNVGTLDLDELLEERGRELAWEGHRRQDLIRFGKYGSAWFAKPANSSPNQNLFPIPQTEIEKNPNLVQNP